MLLTRGQTGVRSINTARVFRSTAIFRPEMELLLTYRHCGEFAYRTSPWPTPSAIAALTIWHVCTVRRQPLCGTSSNGSSAEKDSEDPSEYGLISHQAHMAPDRTRWIAGGRGNALEWVITRIGREVGELTSREIAQELVQDPAAISRRLGSSPIRWQKTRRRVE